VLDPEYLDNLIEGARLTIEVTAVAALLGTAIALVGGVLSLSSWWPVRAVVRVYVEVFRGVSAVILLFWMFFAVPLFGPQLTDFTAGVVALGINMGAYGIEIVRGSLRAVDKGQTEAGVALNLRPAQRMRHVILPQAISGMLPPYGNLLIELLKGTALVSLITLNDITFQAGTLRNLRVDSSVAIFSTVLVMYFAIALVITAMVRLAERYFGRGVIDRSAIGGAK
jgi:polar amino acid transport system permease protein